MANASSTAPTAAGKSNPYSIPADLPPLVGGLVQHVLTSASVQVRISPSST